VLLNIDNALLNIDPGLGLLSREANRLDKIAQAAHDRYEEATTSWEGEPLGPRKKVLQGAMETAEVGAISKGLVANLNRREVDAILRRLAEKELFAVEEVQREMRQRLQEAEREMSQASQEGGLSPDEYERREGMIGKFRAKLDILRDKEASLRDQVLDSPHDGLTRADKSGSRCKDQSAAGAAAGTGAGGGGGACSAAGEATTAAGLIVTSPSGGVEGEEGLDRRQLDLTDELNAAEEEVKGLACAIDGLPWALKVDKGKQLRLARAAVERLRILIEEASKEATEGGDGRYDGGEVATAKATRMALLQTEVERAEKEAKMSHERVIAAAIQAESSTEFPGRQLTPVRGPAETARRTAPGAMMASPPPPLKGAQPSLPGMCTGSVLATGGSAARGVPLLHIDEIGLLQRQADAKQVEADGLRAAYERESRRPASHILCLNGEGGGTWTEEERVFLYESIKAEGTGKGGLRGGGSGSVIMNAGGCMSSFFGDWDEKDRSLVYDTCRAQGMASTVKPN